MLGPPIYRAAFLPALLALIVGAFSIGDRPRPAKTPLAADAFDELRAATTLRDLARRYPHRAPGSAGDRGLAGAVAGALRADDFTVRVHDLTGETIDGERSLQTVVGVRAGFSTRRIVVVAHRDAAFSPATADLSGTAALLELARVFSGRRLNKTLVFVSTSGGSGGAAGLRDYAKRFAAHTDAMIVLGDLAGTRERRPQGIPWSDG